MIISFSVFNKELEKDIAGDTSGHFKRLLVGCLQANRPEGTEFNRVMAKQDAQVLYKMLKLSLGSFKKQCLCFYNSLSVL